MSLSANTMLCNAVSRIVSYFNWNIPLGAEPVGLKKFRPQKSIPRKDIVDGNAVLRLFPAWPREDLACLIETQIRHGRAGLPAVFATPFVPVGPRCNQDSRELLLQVMPPATTTPHVAYRMGFRQLDFSRVCFERREVEKFLSNTDEATPDTGKDSGSRVNWEQTIASCTVILSGLAGGSLAPLTKDDAKKLAAEKGALVKQAFEAWWREVPDKFKKGARHNYKQKNK